MLAVELPVGQDEHDEQEAWQVQAGESSQGSPDTVRDQPAHVDAQVEHRTRHDADQREPIIKLLLRNKIVRLELGVHDRQDHVASSDY